MKYIPFLFVVISIILLGNLFNRYDKYIVNEKAKNDTNEYQYLPTRFIADSLSVRIDSSIAKISTDYDNSNLLIAYLEPEVCAPCLNEVFEFIEVTNRYQSSSTPIIPLIFVSSQDTLKAKHFFQVVKFPTTVLTGYSTYFAQTIGKWKEQENVQLLSIVNPKENKIIYRERITTAKTPIQRKEELLNALIQE